MIRLRTLLLLTLVCFSGSAFCADAANPGKRRGVIIPLKTDINPLSGELLKRKFKQAIDDGADVIILDIHSPGGWVEVTFDLMDMVLDAEDVETVAYIEKDAISGAALVALATDTILIGPGARMGDAGEIIAGPDGAYRYTEAKSRSVIAQKARDTAAATGRPLALAEKMTDKDMVVYHATHKTSGEKRYLSDKELASMADADQWDTGKPIREAGKDVFFTVNGQRAVELEMADQIVTDRSQLADVLNLETPIQVLQWSSVDTLIWVLNLRFVTALLLVIALVALAVELSMPGIGVGGLVSTLCFGLFFWSRFLGGTSGWLEVTLFVLGILFLAVEAFVIPGFGVAGFGGIVLTIGSLVMASRRIAWPESGEQWTSLGLDVLTVVGAVVGFFIAILLLMVYANDLPAWIPLPWYSPRSSAADAAADEAAALAHAPAWQRVQVGQVGTSVSPLRPGGKIRIEDDIVDVLTEGDYVEPETRVKIIAKQGSRITVRAVG